MAKRVTSLTINWASVLDHLLPNDRAKVIPIKMLADKYSKEVVSKPSELPKIDWENYRSKVNNPSKVDLLQKAYESLKIPYPSDQGALAETEKLNANLLQHANKLYDKLLSDIKTLEDELKELNSVMKYSEMTMEELFMAEPRLRIDPKKPFLIPWPHVLQSQNLLENLLARGHTLGGKVLTEEDKVKIEKLLKSL